MAMDFFKSYFSTHADRFISEWSDFLRFKSISSDPRYHDDCLACARWVFEHLERIGFTTHLWESETKPIVYGVLEGDPQKPTVLFYGHYDVQPPEPLELWESGPFEPSIRNGRMYARGAEDNKGQVFSFFKAVEALVASGVARPTIKVVIEGEEESGSAAIAAGLSRWGSNLKADILAVADTQMIDPDLPTITMGLRGIAACGIEVHGPAYDIHSGLYGGLVLNPLQVLAKILAALHNEDGSVAVPGFYDGIQPPSAQDRSLANAAPIDFHASAEQLGVPLRGGERGFSPVERKGFRPTLEINGVGGGHQGAGGKTIIPALGFAKISMRLVAGQDPDRILERFSSYVTALTPDGVTVKVVDARSVGGAFQLSSSSPIISKAREAVLRAFGKEPALLWEGASVPIIPALAEAAGAEPLLVGFGLEEDLIHSPNESFSLKQFEDGYLYSTSFLSIL